MITVILTDLHPQCLPVRGGTAGLVRELHRHLVQPIRVVSGPLISRPPPGYSQGGAGQEILVIRGGETDWRYLALGN